ncbi:DUF7544 domain-containing protein [Halorubrum sp. DTA98]|uniref:DUF7544 domain-containing protein n=1 Tax=Halorubrum sp. DTA98 TaxID=3402163 RepID=UPI003AADEB05
MTWHAVDAVDDAVDATRRFLFPFGLVRWTKLALLVLCMGVGVSTNVSVPPVPGVEATTLGWSDLVALAAEVGIGSDSLTAIGVAITVASILLAILSLGLRLVFYDALRTNEVRLWRPFTRRFRQAVGLFVFSVLLGLLLGGPFALAALASERGLVAFDALSTGVLVAAVVAGVCLVVVGLLVARLTFEFVVPVMVLRDAGPVAAWQRFLTPLRESWTEFVVYLVIHFFVALAVSIAEGVVLLFVGGIGLVLAALALLVVAGVLGGLAALTGTTTGLVAVAVVALLAFVAIVAVLLPVRLLTRTYLIAYEVSTLGGIDPDLALLAAEIDPRSETPGNPPSQTSGETTPETPVETTPETSEETTHSDDGDGSTE